MSSESRSPGLEPQLAQSPAPQPAPTTELPPAPPSAPLGPVPRGKAPFRWKGYPGVSLTSVQRSPVATVAIVLAGMIMLFVLVAGAGLVSRAAGWSHDTWALALLGVYLFGYGLWFLLVHVVTRGAGGTFGERFGLRGFDTLPGLIAAFVVMSLALYFELLYGGLIVGLGIEVPKLPSVAEVFPLTPIGVGVAVIVTCFAAPLSEEMLFRGMLFGSLRDRWGDWPAALVSGALFAASHLNWYVFVPFTVLGVLLAWIVSQTRSVWPAVVAHAVFNLNALVLGYVYYYLMPVVQPSGPGLHAVLTVLLR